MISIIEFPDGYSIRKDGRSDELGALMKRDGWTRDMCERVKDLIEIFGNSANQQVIDEAAEIERELHAIEEELNEAQKRIKELEEEIEELKRNEV